MFNEQVIEWLPQNDWIIECESAEIVDWLLQACEEAGIKCRSGRRATKLKPNAQIYPIIIIYCAEDKTIHQGMENKTGTLVPFFVKRMGYENITDRFFNAIKNTDDKLTPQNAKQEHLVQMLLAKLQGIPVEYWSTVHYKWLDSNHDAITASATYRIKPTFNPETSLTERPEGV